MPITDDSAHAEAVTQVDYEKTVVDSTIAKSFYVAAKLEEAGYCEEHRAGMMDVIMAASIGQQLFDILQDIRTHIELISEDINALREAQNETKG